MNRGIFLLSLLLIITILFVKVCHAQDEQAYCDWQHESARAQDLLLVSPSLVAGLGRSNTSTGAVAVMGVTESLSQWLQGNITTKIGDSNCEMYRSINDITEHTQYDVQILNNNIYSHRIEADETAMRQFDEILDHEQEMLKAGTSTAFEVAALESARQKLQADIDSILALVQTDATPPGMDLKPLGKLLITAVSQIRDNQELTAKLARLKNWDVAATVGMGTNPGQSNSINFSEVKPYVQVNGVWSFGSIARDRELNKAADSYVQWNKSQTLGPIKLAEFLKTKLFNLDTANRVAITNFEDYLGKIVDQEKKVENIDTPDAHRFLVQLEIERIDTEVNLDIASYSSRVAREYLAVNFPIN